MLISILTFILSVIAYLLLAILILFLAMLIIPYQYHVAGQKYEKSLLEGSITWLFGGLNIEFCRTPKRFIIKFTIFRWLRYSFEPLKTQKKKKALASEGLEYSKNMDNPTHDQKKTKHKNQAGSRSKGRKFSVKEFLKPAIIKEAYLTLIKILKHSMPKNLSLSAKVGFSDPMYTGLLYGLLCQFEILIQKHNFQLQPVFDDEILEGRFLIGGRVRILSLLLSVLGFLISKPVRSIYIPKLFTKNKKYKGGPQYVN